MKIFVVLLSVTSCTWAKLHIGAPIDLGPFDVDVTMGRSKPRYPELTTADLVASSSARQVVDFLLPFYDPFKLAKTNPMKIDSMLVKGTVKASKIVMRGLKDLQVNDLQMRMYSEDQTRPDNTPYRIDLNVTLSRAQLDADIDAKVRIFLVHADVYGHVKVRVEGLTVSGAASAAPVLVQGQTVYQHHAIQGRAHVDNIQVKLDLKGVPFDILDNHDLVRQAAHAMKDVVARSVAATVLEKSNEILARYPQKLVDQCLLHPPCIPIPLKPVEGRRGYLARLRSPFD